MADIVKDFFAELSGVIVDFLSFIFDFIFISLYDGCVTHGKNLLNFVLSITDITDLSSILDGNFLYFVLGLPVVILLFKILIDIIRG